MQFIVSYCTAANSSYESRVAERQLMMIIRAQIIDHQLAEAKLCCLNHIAQPCMQRVCHVRGASPIMTKYHCLVLQTDSTRLLAHRYTAPAPAPATNWTCHNWTPQDNAKIASCEKAGGRRRGCDAQACADGGNTWTSGASGYSGCGTCWCCQRYNSSSHNASHPLAGPWTRQGSPTPPPLQGPALPTQTQLDFHQRELTQFMHFSLSTFAPINTDGQRCVVKEQNCLDSNNQGSGSGNHTWPASLFNPELLDTDQWVATAKEWCVLT
jgi:hypothetical protein